VKLDFLFYDIRKIKFDLQFPFPKLENIKWKLTKLTTFKKFNLFRFFFLIGLSIICVLTINLKKHSCVEPNWRLIHRILEEAYTLGDINSRYITLYKEGLRLAFNGSPDNIVKKIVMYDLSPPFRELLPDPNIQFKRTDWITHPKLYLEIHPDLLYDIARHLNVNPAFFSEYHVNLELTKNGEGLSRNFSKMKISSWVNADMPQFASKEITMLFYKDVDFKNYPTHIEYIKSNKKAFDKVIEIALRPEQSYLFKY